MRSKSRSSMAVAVLAQGAMLLPPSAGLANVIAMPQDLWLPGVASAEILLSGPEAGEGRIFLAQSCNGDCTPPGNDTVDPGGNDTVDPGGNDTVDPGGNDTVDPGGNDTVDPGGNDTVDPGGNDTVDPGGNDTVDPGGNDTVDPGGNDTVDTGGNDTVDTGGGKDPPLMIPQPIHEANNPPQGTVLSDRTTDAIAARLSEANITCGGRLPMEYRIDCIRNYYADLAQDLPNTGDYRPVKQALLQAVRQLDAIVRANLDPTAPKIRPNRGNKPDSPRIGPLRAVKPTGAKKAAKAAGQVIAETSLVILRSGEDPTRRTAHYAEISTAMESNLTILRSA